MMWGDPKPLPWVGVNGAGSLKNGLLGSRLPGMHLITGPTNTHPQGVRTWTPVNPHGPQDNPLPLGSQPGSPQALGYAPPGTHFPLAECLAVILSSSFLPVLRSCLPSMEPVCTAFSGSQKVICELSVATASSAPSGRKVTARAKKRRVIRARENPGLQLLGHSALRLAWHPEDLRPAGPT